MGRKIQTKNNTRLSLLFWLAIPLAALYATSNLVIHSANQVKGNEFIIHKTYSYKDIQPIDMPESGAVTFWFDDAWKSQYNEAYQLLSGRGLPAALAVSTDQIGYDAYVNWEQIITLAESGWEITSHSKQHECEVEKLSFTQLNDEIYGSKKVLLKHGIETNIYVPPCGVTTNRVQSLALYHYDYLRRTTPGENYIPVTTPYALSVRQVGRTVTPEDVERWISNAEEHNLWIILMFHQIDSSDTKYGTTTEYFQEIVDLVEESELKVVTPTQILSIT